MSLLQATLRIFARDQQPSTPSPFTLAACGRTIVLAKQGSKKLFAQTSLTFSRLIRPSRMFDSPASLPALEDFHAAVRSRSGRWYGACLRITRDAQLAEDAVQDALLKAWDRRAQFRLEAELDTWIHRIALNAALDLVRKQRPDSVDPEELEQHSTPAPSPEAQYTHRAFNRDLDGAMTRLSQLERESFLLKHIEGWSLAEIAERQCTTVNNTKQTLFRAMRKLREELQDWRSEP